MKDLNKYFPEIPKDLDQKEYNHRIKYRKLYIKLIERCEYMTKEELSGYNERHHIIPKCMNGSDTEDNIIVVPVRYHIMLHILLTEIFPDDKKILLASSIMLYGNEERRESIEKHFSTRTVARLRENASKAKIGREISEETRKKLSIAKSGKNHPLYGKKMSEETKRQMSESHKKNSEIKSEQVKQLWKDGVYDNLYKNTLRKKRGSSHLAKKVVSPEGKIYDCVLDAVDATGIPNSTLRGWMKGIYTKNNPGWHYLDSKNASVKHRKKTN